VTYQDIAHKFNASTATISRVNRCLEYGAGGYRLVLDRMKETE
jgi:TrpR-related protein YerC/YecD